MGNIGSQNGHLKYKPTNTENLQWPHSFPRTQTRFQQDQLKVLPEKTPKIRLRHTENGEILQTGGTLTGRQIQSKFGEPREIKKCGSEPHLHSLMNSHQSDSFDDRDRKFRKKYRAPPPPNQGGKSNDLSADHWENKNSAPPKPRLFKTKIQTERKRSVPDYQEQSDYFQVPHRSLQDETTAEQDKHSYPPPSHRLSLPALNTPAWDFQGELKEATRRLRKIRSEEKDEFLSTSENNLYESTKRNKLKTLDHHIDRRDLIKLKSTNVIKNEGIPSFIRSEPSGKESSIEEPPPKSNKEKKSEAPKPFYFGMSSVQKLTTSPKLNNSKANTKFRESNYPDSDSSIDIKHSAFDSDADVELKTIVPKKLQELQRFSPITKWKQSSSVESVMHPLSPEEYKSSSEENEEPPRVFSIFPIRSTSNDRSGDSGISGDGSPAVYEDTSEPLTRPKNKSQISKSTIPGWTPQQDLGDDSSFEEESLSVGDYNETFEAQSNQHVFSLSLPRENYLPSFETADQNTNETNFEKIRRSVSGILNTMHRKEAESTPENEKGNWFLNKSCTTLNSSNAQMKFASDLYQTSDELDEFLSRNSKHNTGRLMYLPKPDKSLRPRRYEARNKQKSVKGDIEYIHSGSINGSKSTAVPENLQDSPILNERKTFKKKPKRFTFQSTIRQIERKRIADKLSREAERKEQQRLRELEVMQKVEKEFQKKRAREKVNIKQQLSRYTYENSRSVSPNTKMDAITPVREALHTRSEPDGAVSSSPTSSLNQSDNASDDNRSKAIMQTQVLSEYRQPQREYRDYQSSKKNTSEGVDNQRQTTIHPKVTYKMPKSKGMTRSGSNNYRKDFACGIRAKSETPRNQQQVQIKSSPNKYYSQFGPLTRF